jgi:ATP-dependent Clp protease ATP-binding subunit ClpB
MARLPDSAIDLVDEACSALRMNKELKPEVLEKLEKRQKALDIDIRSLKVASVVICHGHAGYRPFVPQAEPGDPGSATLLGIAEEEKEEVARNLTKERDDYDRVKFRRTELNRLKQEIATQEKRKLELESKYVV